MSDSQRSSSAAGTVDGPPRTASRTSLHVPADLTLYAALLGCDVEIDPSLADPMVAASIARRANPWSPAALTVYLREVAKARGPKVVASLNRPEVAAWLRRQSATARRRITGGGATR
jgi:hypothetical protein